MISELFVEIETIRIASVPAFVSNEKIRKMKPGMSMMAREGKVDASIRQAMTSVVSATDPRSRFFALCAALAPLGLDQINYGFFDPMAAERDEAEVVFLSTMRSDWLEHYSAQGLHLTDPHVVKVRAGNLLPYWWSNAEVQRLEDRSVRVTACQIEEAGIRSAICAPLASPFDPVTPVAGMTLGSSLGGSDLAGELGSDAARMLTLVHLFHQLSLGELRRRTSGVAALSPRESDCLRYIADGLQQDEVAYHLSISRVTVEVHLRNAKRKLKAHNLPQAVARAIVFGEIPPN